MDSNLQKSLKRNRKSQQQEIQLTSHQENHQFPIHITNPQPNRQYLTIRAKRRQCILKASKLALKNTSHLHHPPITRPQSKPNLPQRLQLLQQQKVRWPRATILLLALQLKKLAHLVPLLYQRHIQSQIIILATKLLVDTAAREARTLVHITKVERDESKLEYRI